MRRLGAALLLLLMMGMAGCTPSEPAAVPPPPPPPAQVKAPATGLMSFRSPQELTLEGLTRGLEEFANAGPPGELVSRLEELYDHWHWKPEAPAGRIRLAEADLDGNGSLEVVTALLAASPGGGINAVGRLFVIYQKDGQYKVDWTGGEETFLPALHAVADLTGDGRPEIIWSSTQVGAHTAHSRVFASNWQPGEIRQLPGDMVLASMKLSLEGSDLVLQGGLIGSVGAGGYQRERTDRYRWVQDRFQQVDQRFTDSDEGYHRLQDGIAAEQYGRLDDARRAYREAFDPGIIRDPMAFEPAGDLTKEAQVDLLAARARFADALHNFARFRLGALLLKEGRAEEARTVLQGAKGAFAGLPGALLAAGNREAGCAAATEWAQANPAFLKALNSPYGYANPRWTPKDLCGGMPLPQ